MKPERPDPSPPPPATPASSDPLLDAALHLIATAKYDEARVTLDTFRAQHGPTGWSALLFAMTFHKERRYSLARPHFEQALKLEPREVLTQYYLGYCLYYLGEPEASRRSFEAYLEKKPQEGDAHFGLGLLALDAGRLDEAEQRFRGAIELQEKLPNRKRETAAARARLSDVLVQREKLGEAKAQLQQALQLDPDMYTAWFKLYRVLVRLGEKDAAAEALAKHEEARRRVRPTEAFPE